MSCRQSAMYIEDLRRQLDQLRRPDCAHGQILDAIAETIDRLGACLQQPPPDRNQTGKDSPADRGRVECLRQREQHYRSLFDYNLDAAFSLDMQARLTEVNRRAVQLTGYSQEELLGTSVLQLVVPEDRPQTEAAFHEALLGRPKDMEITITHKTGRLVDIYITGGPIVIDGQTVGAFGIARDITQIKRAQNEIRHLNEQLERRVAERTASLQALNLQLQTQIAERRLIEQELRRSETQYRGIVENTHDVIMLTQSDGTITYMSPAAQKVFGYEPAELTGGRLSITHPDDAKQVATLRQSTLQGRGGMNLEYRIVTKDGQTRWVSHSWSIIPGHPSHTVVNVICDITGRKKAQAQIERHEAQLRALASELILAEERERRRIAIGLHDDLGQKLAVAKIRLTMLTRSASGTDLHAPLGQLLEIIDEAMESSRSLTFQVCPPALYDLGLLPAVEGLAEDLRERYGLCVRLANDRQIPPIDERVRIVLFRCLRELLINVAKHAGVNEATVQIQAHRDTVLLNVTDKGRGFDPVKLVGDAEHRGFGLFSIQERLGHLGGHVEFCSAPGRGTTVTLQVPAQLPDSADPKELP